MQSMELNTESLCRLCFEEGNINIFDENGRSLEISPIIKQHFDCEVNINFDLKLTLTILIRILFLETDI